MNFKVSVVPAAALSERMKCRSRRTPLLTLLSGLICSVVRPGAVNWPKILPELTTVHFAWSAGNVNGTQTGVGPVISLSTFKVTAISLSWA